MNSQQAILSNESNYTVFRAGDKVIRFRAPYSLEHYTEVKEWNHGYIVAMAKYICTKTWKTRKAESENFL